jgi:hypothetical protein
MKKITSLFVVLLFSFSLLAQVPGDTIIVQSLVHASNTRDTMVSFPNLPNVSFEKIIMRYNMRCKGAQVSTAANRNLGCGEWDYSCNTFIKDSSKIDSIGLNTLNYKISNFSGTTFPYTTTAINNYLMQLHQNVTIDSILSDTAIVFGTGSSTITHPLPTDAYGSKSQYLYTQSELQAAGAYPGNLDGLEFFINQATFPVNYNHLKIKIKHTNKNSLNASEPDTSGFVEVYFNNVSTMNNTVRLPFFTPFNWDGTSNIIVELSYTNQNAGTASQISGANTAYTSGIHNSGENLLYFDGNNYIEANNFKGISGSQSRTVEAWIKTNVADKEICSWGRNAANVKWVFRVEGAGRLRVENGNGGIVGTTILTDDEWHHVACTFNGTTLNDVQLYVDGQLETNSSNSATAINTDTAGGLLLRVSRGVNNRYFDGYIDNVRIWDTDLSATTIQNWMHKKLTASHPNSSNLVAHYHLNTISSGAINDASGNGNDAAIINSAIWTTISGENHFKEFEEENTRPEFIFYQGNYNLTISTDTAYLTVAQLPHAVQQTSITTHPGTLMHDEINYAPINYYWQTNLGSIYFDTNNQAFDTVAVSPTGTLNLSDLPYQNRYPMEFEIMSFVTPYGIGLDLGSDGKTWSFDVTDFAPILKGDKMMSLTFGGQWQEEMDIKWYFIVGTPPADVLDINNIWRSRRSSNYSNINNDVVFPPRSLSLSNDAASFKIRSTVTGHGQQGEFIPRNHHLNVDGGAREFSWTAWKECADNPVYPQGGTWIYDRAGWCPGMATDLQESNLDAYVSPGGSHTFDYDVDVASGDSRYIVSHQLVNYGAANHSLDARIIDVINPSTQIEHFRENPICNTPKVVIQNVGSTTLTDVKIDYGLNDKGFITHQWTGSLDFMEKDTVTLPLNPYFWDWLDGPNGNVFHAKVKEPNFSVDEYALNDKMYMDFEIPDVLPDAFRLMYKGNNAFQETKVEILDDQNNAVFTKVATGTSITFDSIQLQTGCYSLLITDSDDDGIDFWANSDGTGLVQLRSYTNTILYVLEGDFGKYSRYNFSVNLPLSYEDIYKTFDAKIYPNPAHNQLNIEAGEIEKASIEIIDALGKKIALPMTKNKDKIQLNTTSLANGFYFIRMQFGDKKSVEKFFIQH